jgi:4-amino-4-deoxy-L-arabinose transferase-like glycosyltransferase
MLLFSGQKDVIAEVLVRQNLARFVNPWDHQAPFWYYLESLWADMAPWALFVPLAIGLPRRDEGERRLALLSSIWLVAVIAFFSFSKSKRSPYILPISPAVAILAAEVALAFTTGLLRGLRRTLFVTLTAILSGAFVCAGVVVFAGALTRLEKPTAGAVGFLGLVATLVGAWVLYDLVRPRKRYRAAVSLAAATAAIYLAAAGVTLPALDVYKSARRFCADVSQLVRPGDEVASYAFWNWRAEYRYYLGLPITNLLGVEPLRETWNGPRRVVLLVEAERIADARQVIGHAKAVIEGRVGGGSVSVFTNR